MYELLFVNIVVSCIPSLLYTIYVMVKIVFLIKWRMKKKNLMCGEIQVANKIIGDVHCS